MKQERKNKYCANDIAANHEAYAYTTCYDFLESGGIPIPLFFIMSITRAAVHKNPHT